MDCLPCQYTEAVSMATHTELLFLIGLTVTTLQTGNSGFEVTVYSSEGHHATLPCGNVIHSNCSSTTWLYSCKHGGTVAMMEHGRITVGSKDKAGRLDRGSGCSLDIRDVREQDAGQYTCRQFKHENGPQEGPDYTVELTVLKVHSSPSLTLMKPGSSVTLYCSLQSCKECGQIFLKPRWVNEEGGELKSMSGVLTISSHECNTTLTVKLQEQHNNREWKCQVADGQGVKATVSYFTKWPGDGSPLPLQLVVSVSIAVCFVFSLVAVLLINKTRTNAVRSQKAKDGDMVTLDTATIGVPVLSDDATDERADNITYAEVTAFNKTPLKTNKDQPEDSVTYATVSTS